MTLRRIKYALLTLILLAAPKAQSYYPHIGI